MFSFVVGAVLGFVAGVALAVPVMKYYNKAKVEVSAVESAAKQVVADVKKI